MAVCFFAFVVFVNHWRNTTEYGSDIARQLLPQTLLISLLLTLVITLNGLLRAIPLTLAVLSAWLVWLRHMLQTPVTGQILLRWKRNKETGEIVSIVFAVLFAILLIVFGPTQQPLDVDTTYIGLLFILLVPIIAIEKSVSLSENGIETSRVYVRWEQIESYRWSKYDKSVTRIFFKATRRLPTVNFVELTLPIEQKDAVNEIVLRKVQHIPAATETTAPSV